MRQILFHRLARQDAVRAAQEYEQEWIELRTQFTDELDRVVD